MERNHSSRVYINPNFNRSIVGNIQNVTNMQTSNNMHINPYYANTQNKKIYINPNFIPSQAIQVAGPSPQKVDEKLTPNIARTIGDDLARSAVSVPTKPLVQIQVADANISRYRLVRHIENKLPATKTEKTESQTVKISKYKSVRVSDIKQNLDTAKQSVTKFNCTSKYTTANSQMYNQKQKEGTINTSNKVSKTPYAYVKNKDHARKTHNNKHQFTNTSVKITRKIKIRKIKVKCHTPCRLFRKYGKCLRNERGNCKYLHDKKHVSICRKFLKGICHDNDCLLSHEVSDKKMPACYFYLQGMCNKPACPYLHVKVNEKAMVCPEFKKGYCEKGNTCLYRHVETIKKSKKKMFVASRIKFANKVKIKMSADKCKTQNDSEQSSEMSSVAHDQTVVKDCRYYKEVLTNEDSCSDSCKVIKPSRCKLGTLPSFIKL